MYGYGNEQAQYTLNRASYGDIPAGMMMGMRTTYGGAYDGINNMMSDIGRTIMPVSYTPPARVNVGFYGQYQQQMGFFSSGMGVLGFNGPGRSQMAADYMYNVGSDFGERVGGGTAGLAGAVGSMGIGSLMGNFLGGGIVGSLAGGVIGSAAAGVVMDAVSQRREINNFLENSSYRYVSSGNNMVDARRGGFNAQGRAQVTDMIRGMDVKDPFMSTEDLTMILQQGTQKGLFAGTQDMNDFKKKFKDLTETVKVVTRTLNQTLEESMNTIKELKSIGVDPSQASGVVRSAQMFGNMAGRTGGEMLNIGLQGAELFRGTGVNMGIGAQATMMNLATVRAARDAGQLSNEAVAQAGGEEALAMRMNASGLGFAQSTLGRGFGAAFMGAGGAFDQSKFMQMAMGGNYNLVGMATSAAGNLSSPAALIGYQANQEKFMSEMGKTFGSQGLQISQMMTIGAQAQFLSGATGAKFEDSYRLSAKQMGLSESEIEAQLGMARGSAKIYASANNAAQMAYEKNLIEEGYRGNMLVNLGSKIRDYGKSVIDQVAAPVSNMIDGMKEKAINFVEEQAYGVRRASVGDIGLDTQIAGARNTSLKVRSLDVGGNFLGTTVGESLDRALTKEVTSALGITKKGDVVINRGLMGDTTIDMKDIKAVADKWSFNSEDLKKAQEKGVIGKDDLYIKLMKAGVGSNTSTEDLIKMAYGKDATAMNISKDQAMNLDLALKGTTLEHHTQSLRKAGLASDAAVNASGQESYVSAINNYKDTESAIRSKMGIYFKNGTMQTVGKLDKISSDAIQAVANAANITDPEKRQEAQLKARAILEHDGFSPEQSKEMSIRGMADTKLTTDLATSQRHIRQAQQDIGTDRLSTMIIASAKQTDMTTSDVEKVTLAAGRLSKAKSAAEFMSVVDANSKLLEKSGGAGVSAVTLSALMKDVGSLGSNDGGKLANLLKENGLQSNEQVADMLRSGNISGLQDKIMEMKKSTLATNSAAVSASAGIPGEGGPTAAQTLTQQMNINTATLQVMQGLAKKLGVN